MATILPAASQMQAQVRSRPIVIRPEFVAIAGDLVVAALLSQIVFWYTPSKEGKSKLRVMRDGRYWVAKTREQWMAETGLTLDQYRRAIKVLRDKGLIAVEQHLFDRKNISHIRLLRPVAEMAPPTQVSENHSLGKVETTHSYTETTSEITSSGYCRSRSAEADGDEKAEKIRGEIEVNAAQILKLRQEGLGIPKGGSLMAHWQRRMSAVYGGRIPLTGKDIGQLKQLHKYLGDQTKTVIDFVIEEWMSFAARAGTAAGTLYPTDPSIGFLLKHHHVAIDLMGEKAQKKPKKVVQPIAEEPVFVQPVAEIHKMTPEEFAAIMESL